MSKIIEITNFDTESEFELNQNTLLIAIEIGREDDTNFSHTININKPLNEVYNRCFTKMIARAATLTLELPNSFNPISRPMKVNMNFNIPFKFVNITYNESKPIILKKIIFAN